MISKQDLFAITHGDVILNNAKEVKQLIKDGFEKTDLTADYFLAPIDLYRNKTITKRQLSYVLRIIYDYIDYLYDDYCDLEDELGQEIMHFFEYYGGYDISEEGINDIYRSFNNIGKPFQEKDLTDYELLEFVNKYSEEKEETLSPEIISDFRYALDKLVEHKNPDGVFLLGRLLYGDDYKFGYKQDFKKALDCYLFAGEHRIYQGYTNAGYIYYYDRLNTGKRDYENAFKCYEKAYIGEGNWNAAYKLSDMYRYGLSVEENHHLALSVIEGIYDSVTKLYDGNHREEMPFPEIVVRYYALAKELYSVNESDDRNLFRAYFYQKNILEKHDYYGSDVVLKQVRDLIYQNFEDSYIRLMYDFDEKTFIKGQQYVFASHEGNAKFLATYQGRENLQGEEEVDRLVKDIFKVDYVFTNMSYTIWDGETFEYSYLNRDLFSYYVYNKFKLVNEKEGYIALKDQESFETLKELIRSWNLSKLKLGKYSKKDGIYKQISLYFIGQNKDKYLLECYNVNKFAFQDSPYYIFYDLHIDEYGCFEIGDSEFYTCNYCICCEGISYKKL